MAKTPRSKIVSKKYLARQERENIQKRYLLIGTLIVLVLVIGVIVYGVLDQRVFQFNRAVAVVNGEKIKLGELQARASFNRVQLVQQYNQTIQLAQLFGQDPNNSEYFSSSLQQIQTQLDDQTSLGTISLNQLIDEKLIEQQAKEMGVTVTDAEVEARVQAFFGFYPKGTPTSAPVPTQWSTPTLSATQLAIVTLTPTPTLEPTPTLDPTQAAVTPTVTVSVEPTAEGSATPQPTPTVYTEAGYKADLKTYTDNLGKYGITEADLRKIFRSELLRERMMDKVVTDVARDQEMVWARHILVADEVAALAALESIKNGEDFAAVAARVSTDESNKNSGGDLGWFARGAMVKEFEDAAFALKIGEISQPVKTSFGYHLIQALGHEVRPLSTDEYDQARQTSFSNWLTGLREKEGAVQTFDFWIGKLPTQPSLSTGV